MKLKNHIRLGALAFVVAAFTTTLIAAPPPAKGGGGGAKPPTTFSGEAAVLDIQVPALGVNQTIVQVGPLPATGGAEADDRVTIDGFRHWSRTAYDIRDGMTKEAAMAKRLKELRAELGLPPL